VKVNEGVSEGVQGVCEWTTCSDTGGSESVSESE
jgi:hypothetical protein